MLKKRSKKKVTAILFFLALLLAMFPDVQSDGPDDRPSPDYGIFEEMENIQDEKNSRINSPEVLNETKNRFDNMTVVSGEERFDLTGGRDIVSPDIPVPELLDIYNAMKSWDKANQSEIYHWLFPPPIGSGGPMNYYIYSKYVKNETVIPNWTNASLRPVILNPEILHLSTWWGVDVDGNGSDDIEVFFDPVLEWTIGEIFDEFLDRILNGDPIEIPITLHFDIHKLNDEPFDLPDFQNLEVYIAKSMSYDGKNFMVFLGLNFTDVPTWFNSSVSVSKVQVGNISIVPGIPPSINWDLANIVSLGGPYHLRWFIPPGEAVSAFSLEIATARIEFTGDDDDPYYFLNRSWVDIDFDKKHPLLNVPNNAELKVDADSDLSAFDEIRWTADHQCDLSVRFFDEQQNVSYAELKIGNLVDDLQLSMTVEEKHGTNVTIIDYNAPGGVVEFLDVHHYEYFDTTYDNITESKIEMGDIEYIHVFTNISRIPRKLYVEGVFFLEEVEATPQMDIGLGMVDEFVNMLAHRVISRFTRIAKTLSSIPYKLLTMAEDGTFANLHTYDQPAIEKIEFLFTSGDYVSTYGNFFAFFNNTHPSEYPIAQISLSGKISNVKSVNASFEEVSVADVEIMSNERFRAIYADDINDMNAEINISNVPGTIRIYKTPDLLLYDGANSVDEVRFVSDYKDSYMDLRITDLADHLYVEFEDERTYVSANDPLKKIGDIQFLVTTGPIIRMEGNHILLREEPTYSALSARIEDISELEYISGDKGKIDIIFIKENAMNISLLDNRSELISADLIIDPMPAHISVNLSGLLSTDEPLFELPDLNLGGVLGFAGVIFGIATMGEEMLSAIDEATQDAMSNVGNLIEDLSFSYTTNDHITLIGKIIRGETFTLSDVDWVHGISAIQEVSGDETAMAAKIYLSGLPTHADIQTKVKGDDIFLDLNLEDFAPIHNWLILDVKGIQDRDAIVYLDEIKSGMDLVLSVNVSTSLNVIPQKASGTINMDSNKAIGSLYARLRQTQPEITLTEVFLDSVPKNLECSFNLSGNINLNYRAYAGIEYLFVKNTKARDKEFHDIYAILHEVPEEVVLSVTPNTDYDMDGSLLQTLPTIDIYCSEGTLDAFIFADGKGIGQVGIVELQVVNVPVTFSGRFKDDGYSITCSGLDYMWIHVMNLPVMKDHETKSLELVGKDIFSFDITMDTLFGNYPVIGIENTKGGEVQIVLDHEMDGDKIGLALVDLKTKDGIPQSPSILINGGSVDLESGTSHVIIPAPILTVWLSAFS